MVSIDNTGARRALCFCASGSLPAEDLQVTWAEAAKAADWSGSVDGFDFVLLDVASIPLATRVDHVERAIARFLDAGAPPMVVCVPPDDPDTLEAAARYGGQGVVVVVADLDDAWRLLRDALTLARDEPGRHGTEEETAEIPLRTGGRIVGASAPMRHVLSLIRKVARSDIAVLITGESGTGKELAAQAVHECSPRAKGPFVPINCGAIPANLLESELFGHERGAFTGARDSRRGLLETAHGGTLFLDEIGDLSLDLQVKLLRFLQDFVLQRLGGNRRIEVDVRIVAATNRSLERAASNGEFREDLLFRLNAFSLPMPPLSDRGQDVVRLAQHVLASETRGDAVPPRGFTRDAKAAMLRYDWPGNVRELENRVRRALVVGERPLLSAGDLSLPEPGEELPTLREVREEAERTALQRATARAGGNRSEAARLLGISRTQFYELLHRHADLAEEELG